MKNPNCELVVWNAHPDVRKMRNHVEGSSDSETDMIVAADDEVWVRVPNGWQQGGCSGKRNVLGRGAKCKLVSTD